MRKNWVLLALLTIALAPVIAASGYYYYSQAHPPALSHRGQLLQPPILLPELNKQVWHIIYLGKDINKLQRLWVALGKDMPRVERNLLQATDKNVQSLQSLGTWFIADPAGYVILAYSDTVLLDDIYHDLKRLLKVSRVG